MVFKKIKTSITFNGEHEDLVRIEFSFALFPADGYKSLFSESLFHATFCYRPSVFFAYLKGQHPISKLNIFFQVGDTMFKKMKCE